MTKRWLPMREETKNRTRAIALFGLGASGALVLLIALLVLLDSRWGFSGWRGWTMLEAIGTTLAVFAAIGLAWREGSKSRRREEEQRQMVRLLLSQEIRTNVQAVESLVRWHSGALVDARQHIQAQPDALWRSAAHDVPPRYPFISFSLAVRLQLMGQLPLFCQSFGVTEAGTIDRFYDGLDDLKDLLSEYEKFVQSNEPISVKHINQRLTYIGRQLDRLALERMGIELVKRLELS